ncbi:putative lipoprotein [Sulfitobacter noctilucae]|uniref:hypothetical protein n=1 Tax=Sulfitobacter noctilucae TaxID=1342302 RepID=UPI00046AB336|nr:hypothetical protein [Sulfitobacter noctilucae]KIN70726.1 putative lipoprotein [Sulfitobacter noctilucae]
MSIAKGIAAGLAALLLLGACGADNNPDSPPQEVAAAAFRSAAPPSLTIFTMVNNRTGDGGHTSLLINGSQQVIFDPAGSFRDDRLAERGDVLFGMTPGWVQAYKSAHARAAFHVVEQKIPVTGAQAEQALQLALANGSVPGGFCASSIGRILRQIDGFQSIDSTFFPVRLMEQIETLPNVTTTRLYENDSGQVIDALRASQLAQ